MGFTGAEFEDETGSTVNKEKSKCFRGFSSENDLNWYQFYHGQMCVWGLFFSGVSCVQTTYLLTFVCKFPTEKPLRNVSQYVHPCWTCQVQQLPPTEQFCLAHHKMCAKKIKIFNIFHIKITAFSNKFFAYWHLKYQDRLYWVCI